MITLFRPIHWTKTGFRLVDGDAPEMKGFSKHHVDASWIAQNGTDEEFKAWCLLGQFCTCGEHGVQDPVVLANAQLDIEEAL